MKSMHGEAAVTTSTWKMILAGALFLSAAGSSILHAQRPAPDLILSNGKIITVDEKFTIAQAVAIRGDRVVAVGSNQAITPLAGPSTRTIDLKGKALIPGLIDNHMHLLRGGTSWKYEVRLDGVATRKQAMAMLTERTKRVGPGQWVYTLGGFAREQFSDDPKAFTTAELDQAFPNNPVALQESYYRFNANSQALKMMGFDEKAMGDVGQGGVGRLAAKLPLATKDEIEASSLGMLKDMNRWGLTAFGVPGCDRDLVQMYRKWESTNQLNARVFCIDGAGGGGGRGAAGVDDTIAQIAQIKKFQGDDYVDDIFYGEGVYGGGDPMFLVKSDPKPEDLVLWRRVGLALAQAGIAMHVHTELHDTINAFLDQIEAINKEHPIRNLRWTLAHMNQVDEVQLERMKKLNVYLALHPWAVINGGINHAVFGDEAYNLPRLATIQNSGIMWGFGTDGTRANQIPPFNVLYFAVTGKMVGGAKVVKEVISREDALIAYTRKNAFLVFQENNLGAIQPGKLADLLVLDRDYLTIPVEQIKDIKPLITMVAGRIVYDADASVNAARPVAAKAFDRN
jgi:predicted amidohydrolase YtcJ